MLYAMADVNINEFLCYLQNNFGKVPKALLCSTLGSFYDELEIVEAKNKLFAFAEGVQSLQDMPRMRSRKAGDSKKRLDTDDIVSLYEYFDRNNVVVPTFVAKNLAKLPAIKPTDVDICTIVHNIGELQSQLRTVQMALTDIAAIRTTVNSIVDTVKALEQMKPNQQTGVTTDAPGSSTAALHPSLPSTSTAVHDHHTDIRDGQNEGHSTSYAALLHEKDDNGQWFPVLSKSKKTPDVMIRKITGCANDAGNKVKAAPKKADSDKTWHVFAGKLAPDTTEDDIADLLEDCGIETLHCKSLKQTEKWQQKFAAFHIVIKYKDKDRIFEEAIWPLGVDVRDWWFKKLTNK